MSPLRSLLHDETVVTSIKRKALLNKLKILEAIHANQGIALPELSRKLKISFPTLNNLVSELVANKIIINAQKGISVGGRKPNLYELNSSVFNVLCIQIERFSIHVSLADNRNEELDSRLEESLHLSKDKSSLARIEELVASYISRQGISWDNISGVIITMPGLINDIKGTNKTFLYESGFSLKDYLELQYKKKVYIINDVKLAAFAELRHGAAERKKNAIVILMDWGIGIGLIINGKVYMGADGYAGEMGHMLFIEDGDLCYCGKRGCLETVASGVALVRQAQKDIDLGVPTLLNHKYDAEFLVPKDIISAALEGDQYAIELITKLGNHLGKAIANLVQLFNPEIIILSGKFAAAQDLITIPIKQSVNTYAMPTLAKGCAIEVSMLGSSCPRAGLVSYFVERYIKEEIQNCAKK